MAGNGLPDVPGKVDKTELSIKEMQRLLDLGVRSSRSLVEEYVARIEAIDPLVHSLTEVNPDATSVADALDAERKRGLVRGPLHGIPIVLKDNIATADSLSTTAGSMALEGTRPRRDAEVARRLRAAGAIFIAKSNMSEWANFRSRRSISGWSARAGQCRNPYALDRSPSGSSSGSAVAAAANLCAASVGTETDGSIISPSSSCGLVGIKPTVGLVSRSGTIPISQSQDTIGPIARTVEDAALLLSVMVGPDPADPATMLSPDRDRDHNLAIEPSLDGVRLGVVRSGVYGTHRRVDEIFDAALGVMVSAGAILVDPVGLRSPDEYRQSEVLLYEFRVGVNRYLRSVRPRAAMKTLDDIIAFNSEHADLELALFGQDLLIDAAKQSGRPSKSYMEARAASAEIGRYMTQLLSSNRLDAFVAPTGLPAWLIDNVNGDCGPTGSWSFSAAPGFPHVTVPGGYVAGLPIGISIFGGAWSDWTLIWIARAFEALSRARRSPRFPPTQSQSEIEPAIKGGHGNGE